MSNETDTRVSELENQLRQITENMELMTDVMQKTGDNVDGIHNRLQLVESNVRGVDVCRSLSGLDTRIKNFEGKKLCECHE